MHYPCIDPQVKEQPAVPEGDLVTFAKPQLSNFPAVDESAVRRVEIAQQIRRTDLLDDAVLFGNLAINQSQRVVGVSAKRSAISEGKLAFFTVGETAREPRPLELTTRVDLTQLWAVTSIRNVSEGDWLVAQNDEKASRKNRLSTGKRAASTEPA